MQANKAKPHNNDHDSLSIIEECLDRIYLSRRANLLTKARKFKERQARKVLSQPHQRPLQRDDGGAVNEPDNYSDNILLEELDLKFKAPPPTIAPVVVQKKKVVAADAAKQNYDEQDQSSIEILREFCDELTLIIEDFPMRLPDDEFRGEHCDALMHKYLSSELDKMMATRTVTKVRKHLAGIIEQFAASENVGKINKLIEAAIRDCGSSPTAANKQAALPDLPTETNAVVKPETRKVISETSQVANEQTLPRIVAKTANNSAAPTKSALKQAPAVSEPTNATNKTTPESSADKAKLEKQRIKAQYEQLMALKKKTENHPDDTVVEEYSALHVDIQSVIDSLQQRPAALADSKAAKKTNK